MLNKLMSEQEILIEQTKNEWLNKFFSCKSIDKDKAIKGINWLYDLAGFKKPLIFFVDSPLAAQFAVHYISAIFKNIPQLRSQVESQVGSQVERQVRSQVDLQVNSQVESQVVSQVRSQVGSQIMSQVWSQVRSQIGSQVWSQVDSQIESQVDSQIESQVERQVNSQVESQVERQVRSQVESQVERQVRSQVDSQVYSQVRSQIGSQIMWQVRLQVESQVDSQVRSQVDSQIESQVVSQIESQIESQIWTQIMSQIESQVRSQVMKYYCFSFYGNCWDYYWCSYIDFFRKIGIIKNKLFDKFVDFLDSNIYDCIQQDKYCIICSMPKYIKRDERNRLHSANSPAIEFNDGFKLWYINGINFGFELWDKIINKKITALECINIKNIEQRIIALKEIGYENVIKELGGKVIDTFKPINHPFDRTYELIELNLQDELVRINLFDNKALNSNLARFVKVICHSTGKEAVLRVPPDTKTVIDAIKWTFALNDKEDYNPIKET